MIIRGLFYFFFIVVMLPSCTTRKSKLTATNITQPTTVTSLPASASPTVLSTRPATTSPSPTLTPPPTLLPEQAEDTIRKMIQEPTAPCFWEICPGQTTLEEAVNIFTHLGLYVERTNTRDGKEYYYVTSSLESDLGFDTLLIIQDGVVKTLELYIDPETEQEDVPREWLAYSPETLIRHYGTPSMLDFSVSGGPRSGYIIVMYFDEVDLIVEYISFKDSYQKTTNSFRLCPLTDQFWSIHIWLGKHPEDIPNPGIILGDATSMTLEEFSELMIGYADDACIDIPRDVMFP
ncbi:MAG: hypothetical protein U9R58_08890 [Chloroflexota bacterium]|nr:hypothetical protein [Chloroflexota bacterium]